ASTLQSECITPIEGPSLTCPASNFDTELPPTALSSYPYVQCKVCGIYGMTADEDTRRGWYTGTLRFGPNQMKGAVDEDPISEYRVYLADNESAPIGHALATVPVDTVSSSGSCCDPGKYTVSLSCIEVTKDIRERMPWPS
ncbi:unnamed protein product, partial [Prorocentrum cordatum]